MGLEIARLRKQRMVVRINDKVSALQHPVERPHAFAARCNALSHYIMGTSEG